MIRITRQTDYAIRVVLALAKAGTDTMLSSAKIQDETLIPKALSARIIANLAKGRFIVTYPGRDGGLTLARPAVEINLREIVEYFEGNFLVSECLHGCGSCPLDHSCPIRTRWGRLQSLILSELERTNFAELAQEAALSTAEVLPFRIEQVKGLGEAGEGSFAGGKIVI